MHIIVLFLVVAVLFVIAVLYPPTAYFIIWLVIAFFVAWLAFRKYARDRTASSATLPADGVPPQVIAAVPAIFDGQSPAANHTDGGVNCGAGADGGTTGCG